MEPTIFGISNFEAIEYPQGTKVEDVACNHDFVIKRVKLQYVNDANWGFNYLILDHNCDPCSIIRNGWNLERFTSHVQFSPKYIPIYFKDNENLTFNDVDIDLRHKVIGNYSYVSSFGKKSINEILKLFVDASNFRTWEEFVKNQIELQEQAGVILQNRAVPCVPEEETNGYVGMKLKLPFIIRYWNKIWGR